MSGDEGLVCVLSFLVWTIGAARWLANLRTRPHVPGPVRWRGALAAAPLLAAGAVLVVLRVAASHDVRDDLRYLAMYTALGGAWIHVLLFMTPWLGISLRDDVVERRNPAAAAALCGYALAFAFVYAGGNIGDGPGWWVVVFSSGLASAAFVVLQLVGLRASGAADLVTIERDLASGLRVGAAAIAQALVLGAASAGNWISAGATLRDFLLRGWPALVIALLAHWLDAWMRPRPEDGERSALAHGVFPGLVLIALGAFAVIAFGGLA